MMAQSFALHDGRANARPRVRMPGKYVTLLLVAPAFLFALGYGVWRDYAERRAAFETVEYRETGTGERAAFYPLPEFLVDLRADDDGRTAYLRIKIAVQLDTAALGGAVEKIDAVKPLLIERVTLFLRELRPEDFDGSQKMILLKAELLRRVNLALSSDDASDVIIEELIIQ